MAVGPKTFIGNVGMEGTATGPHLHEYVKDLRTGQMIDPRTLQSPLLNIRVGQQEVPLAIKDASGKITLNPAAGATITSEFGPRTAPTAGASTDHQGRDIALPYGTPVKYFGGGQYIPQSGVAGFGNLGRIITPDQRYEIGFGHLSSLGTAANAPAPPALPPSDQDAAYRDSQQRTNDLLQAFMYGANFGKGYGEQKLTAQSFADQMKAQMLQSILGGGNFNAPQNQFEDINQQLASAIFG